MPETDAFFFFGLPDGRFDWQKKEGSSEKHKCARSSRAWRTSAPTDTTLTTGTLTVSWLRLVSDFDLYFAGLWARPWMLEIFIGHNYIKVLGRGKQESIRCAHLSNQFRSVTNRRSQLFSYQWFLDFRTTSPTLVPFWMSWSLVCSTRFSNFWESTFYIFLRCYHFPSFLIHFQLFFYPKLADILRSFNGVEKNPEKWLTTIEKWKQPSKTVRGENLTVLPYLRIFIC